MDLFNIFSLFTVLLGQALDIPVVALNNIERQNNKKVYHASMRQIVPYGKTPCQYSGVFVEYVQDWDDYDKNGELKRKGDTEKPVGYALILNKEFCQGAEAKPVLRVGEKQFYLLFGKEYVIRELHQVNVIDYMTSHESLRPKWIAQVIKTLNTESEKNDNDAREFLDEIEKHNNSSIKDALDKHHQ